MKMATVLKKLILKQGNLMDFSKKANIPYNTLRSILDRGAGNSSVNNVMKICKALDITIDQLNQMAIGNENKVKTMTDHFDGDVFTDDELQEIENFKAFVKSKRNKE